MINPEKLFPFDEHALFDAIMNRDRDSFVRTFKQVTLEIINNYRELADAINVTPEYIEAATEPEIGDSQTVVWHDTTASKYYLLFNDNGSTVKVEMT